MTTISTPIAIALGGADRAHKAANKTIDLLGIKDGADTLKLGLQDRQVISITNGLTSFVGSLASTGSYIYTAIAKTSQFLYLIQDYFGKFLPPQAFTETPVFQLTGHYIGVVTSGISTATNLLSLGLQARVHKVFTKSVGTVQTEEEKVAITLERLAQMPASNLKSALPDFLYKSIKAEHKEDHKAFFGELANKIRVQGPDSDLALKEAINLLGVVKTYTIRQTVYTAIAFIGNAAALVGGIGLFIAFPHIVIPILLWASLAIGISNFIIKKAWVDNDGASYWKVGKPSKESTQYDNSNNKLYIDKPLKAEDFSRLNVHRNLPLSIAEIDNEDDNWGYSPGYAIKKTKPQRPAVFHAGDLAVHTYKGAPKPYIDTDSLTQEDFQRSVRIANPPKGKW